MNRLNTFFLTALFALGSASTWAQFSPQVPIPDFSNFAVGPLNNYYWKLEEAKIYGEYSGRKVGDLTLEETKAFSARIGVAKSKDALVLDTAKLSLVWPGAGQFRNGDFWSGAGYSAGDLVVLGGGIYGVYALLPSTLKNDWTKALTPNSGLTLIDYAPAIAIGALTWIVYQGWGLLAAGQAVPETKNRLDKGELKLGPFNIDPAGYGLTLRY